MTREEAIDLLDNLIGFVEDNHGSDYDKALKIAIKALEQEPKWIPVSERLPEELEPVNITWINHNPESYYANIKDKPFTATGVYFNGQWYWWSTLCTDMLAEYGHNHDDIIDDAIEITAWQPLPEPYKPEKIRCNTCKNNDDELSGECYECVKNIQNHYEPEEVKKESEDKE